MFVLVADECCWPVEDVLGFYADEERWRLLGVGEPAAERGLLLAVFGPGGRDECVLVTSTGQTAQVNHAPVRGGIGAAARVARRPRPAP